jgi:hypothetical protein
MRLTACKIFQVGNAAPFQVRLGLAYFDIFITVRMRPGLRHGLVGAMSSTAVPTSAQIGGFGTSSAERSGGTPIGPSNFTGILQRVVCISLLRAPAASRVPAQQPRRAGPSLLGPLETLAFRISLAKGL